MKPETSRLLADIKTKVLEQRGGSERWLIFMEKLSEMTDEDAIREANKLLAK